MKNTGIKILTITAIGTVVLIFINARPHATQPPPEQNNTNNLDAAIARQFNDNIRGVSARLLETEHKLHAIEEENRKLIAQNKSNEKSDESHTFEDMISALKGEIETLKISKSSPQHEFQSNAEQNSIKDIDSLLIKHQANLQEQRYWEQFKPKKIARSKNINPTKSNSLPYFTIPAGSDLAHTTLLSALIGEVPSEGKLMQPLFPFSAIVSRGDLMASNGMSLPSDIAGMKINGYAIGVGSFLDNISCIRAYVTSALFTFQDGHFVTVGREQMTNTTELINNESLGYLTTPFGNPCIHGKYFTNAPRVLGAMLSSGGIQGIGAAISQWQMNTSNTNQGISPVGSFIPFSGGTALSEGSVKAADWLEKRIQGSFDMVFVPASLKMNGRYYPTNVSLHLTQTISIDKELNGRVLDYAHIQTITYDHDVR